MKIAKHLIILNLLIILCLSLVTDSQAISGTPISEYECPESDDCQKRLRYVNSAIRYGEGVISSFCGQGFLDALDCSSETNAAYYAYYAQSFFELSKQDCDASKQLTAKCDSDESAPHCAKLPANAPQTCEESPDTYVKLCGMWLGRLEELELERNSLEITCNIAAEMRCTQQVASADELAKDIIRHKKRSQKLERDRQLAFNNLAKKRKQGRERQARLMSTGKVYIAPIYNLFEARLKIRVAEIKISNCMYNISLGNQDCNSEMDVYRQNLEDGKRAESSALIWFRDNKGIAHSPEVRRLINIIRPDYLSLERLAKRHLDLDTRKKNADALVKELSRRFQEIFDDVIKNCDQKFKDQVIDLINTL